MLTPEQLIHGHFDGTLSTEEQVALNDLLKSEPAMAEQFASVALLHDSLTSGFRSGTLAHRHSEHPSEIGRSTHTQPHTQLQSDPVRKPNLLSFIKPAFPWALATAALVIALVAMKHASVDINQAPVASTEKIDTGYAVLTRVVDPEWRGETSPTQGDVLSKGILELTSGLVQIEFFSGVSLVVEGDTALEIISPDEMHLIRGKLRAHVPPPAIGFQIHTPHGTVLDLGTEFALDLTDEQCELHVIDGEVEWHHKDAPEVLLTRGAGLRLSDEKPTAIPAEPKRFTSAGQLGRQIARHQGRRFTEWKKHSLTLREQDNLLAYFPMGNISPWNRELVPTQENLSNGAIVAAKVVEGRWPAKQALDFSPNGSRVRVNIPGEHEQITFATWAKIDSLDRQFNALFLTDNYDKGEPHWQLTDGGEIFFSVGIGKERLHHVNLSPVIWQHTDGERWLHLATTYDCATRTCIHYVNGEEVSRDQAPEDKAVPFLTIGNAQIGNWGLPTREEPEFAVRNLNGRLDEFSIFSSVLSPEEVHILYLAGKP